MALPMIELTCHDTKTKLYIDPNIITMIRRLPYEVCTLFKGKPKIYEERTVVHTGSGEYQNSILVDELPEAIKDLTLLALSRSLYNKHNKYKDAIERFLKDSSWDRYKNKDIRSIELYVRDTDYPIQCGVIPFQELECILND